MNLKKLTATVIAVALAVCMVGPLTVKAADDGLFYITYQANINNQTMIDNGYNASLSNGSAARYMTNAQIETFNNFGLPEGIDLSDWDYYILVGTNSWQGENYSLGSPSGLVVYNGSDIPILYKGRPQLRDQYSAIDGYRNGSYGWDYGSLSLYHSNLDEMRDNGDLKIFNVEGENWVDRSSDTVMYQDISFQLNGNYIVSSNHSNFYYGKDIDLNSTKTVTNYYDQPQVVAFINDGIENSPNLMPSFQVTKDGTNYESWDDAFGEPEIDYSLNQGLGFKSFEAITMFDGSHKPTIGVQVSYALNQNGNFDANDALIRGYEYGIVYKFTINYQISASSDPKIFQPIFGESWSGTVNATIMQTGMTWAQICGGTDYITFSDIFDQPDSIVTGVDDGAKLLLLMNYCLTEGKTTIWSLPSFTGGELIQALEDYNTSAGIGSIIKPLRNYGLRNLTIQITAMPVCRTLQENGVISGATVDYLSGASSGYTSDIVSGDTIIPGDQLPDMNKYLMPQYDPTGNQIYVVVDGNPSDQQSNNGIHGSGNSYVNVTMESGIKELLNRIDTWDKIHWNQSWWSVFGTFEENPASALYREYFSWLPPEFIVFFTKVASIVLLVGAAKFIRKV